MGVNTTRYKVLSFAISSAFAGVAGVLFGHFKRFLPTPDFTFIKSFEVIIMIVLGGMGSITGAVLGAVVITILPEMLRQLDRKSTRLNSSHANISYAVFCLKKNTTGTRL